MDYYDPLIIGISGKKQSGKDTIANELVRKNLAVKFSFADRLKQFCNIHFNVPKECLWGSEEYKNQKTNIRPVNSLDDDLNLSSRQLLQYFGTDL